MVLQQFVLSMYRLPGKAPEHQFQGFFVGHILGVCRKEGINENLKATDQIDWVAHMNIISDRTIEIVNADLIFV